MRDMESDAPKGGNMRKMIGTIPSGANADGTCPVCRRPADDGYVNERANERCSHDSHDAPESK